MKVLYDATPLLMRSAGVKNYHHALLTRLLPLAKSRGVAVELFPYLDSLPPNENERSNYPPAATAIRLAGVLGSNYLGLPVAAPALRDADLFHFTHHLMRPPEGAPLTTMVHDPTPLTMPECHTASNIRYFERFVEKTLPRTAGILTPSAAVRDELVSRFGASEDRVRAVHHGVDPDFFEPTQAQVQVAAKTYGLPESFVLFLGSLEPRKNLERLAQAFDLLPEALQSRYPLIIAGATGWKNSRIRRSLRRNRHIHAIGYVRRELLPAVYTSCSLFAFPSLYEGFGLPAAEAMAAGAPVLTSNVSALPEVVGDCAVRVDPYSVDAIAAAMLKILSDPHTAAKMADRGRQRARMFDWSRTADETLAFFAATLRRA